MRVDISGSWLYIYTYPFDTTRPASELLREDYRVKKAICLHAISAVEVSPTTHQIVLHVQGTAPFTLWSVNEDCFARMRQTLFQAFEQIGMDIRYL